MFPSAMCRNLSFARAIVKDVALAELCKAFDYNLLKQTLPNGAGGHFSELWSLKVPLFFQQLFLGLQCLLIILRVGSDVAIDFLLLVAFIVVLFNMLLDLLAA